MRLEAPARPKGGATGRTRPFGARRATFCCLFTAKFLSNKLGRPFGPRPVIAFSIAC